MSRKPLSVQAQQDCLRRKRREAGEVLTIFRKPLKESLASVLPITAIVLVHQRHHRAADRRATPWWLFLFGASAAGAWAWACFTLGVDMSMIPHG